MPQPDTAFLDLLGARYGGAVPAAAEAPMNAVLQNLLSHRSVRAFRPDALPDGVLETLIAAAQSAPTSSNMQSWSVVAIRDPERKVRLAELAARQGFIRQAPLFLAFLADTSRLDRLGQREGQTLEGLQYLESFLVAAVDAALAAQNVVVAAESLGLGSVYVGALRNRPEEVAAELGLPPGVMAVFGLAVGVPDEQVPTAIKPRLPQSLVLHHERYEVIDEAAQVTAYDGALAAFSERQGMGAGNGWVRRMLTRVASGASLSGRDRMQGILHRLGFPLR
ncbi:NADPH-dependent oxidoreductase [Roseomonas aerophila]|uniref:NADPH-dependent oxidoreductase n=1 Tax=Teichococcus aerophilus TaxID=1224513 RepID=A0ABR7RG71_9PROT|nr:NADPH-dependent oxidoreductase [Pseudoroseomonas aerophila]MBC9205559.1 NADPH-dependent oxidoreductase [Pseudoroseomonas aerophila]